MPIIHLTHSFNLRRASFSLKRKQTKREKKLDRRRWKKSKRIKRTRRISIDWRSSEEISMLA